MKAGKIILLILLIALLFSCSKKATIDNLNKPVYNDLLKNTKIIYESYGNNPIDYNKLYNDNKYEVDFCINYRNKVIDSIKLLDNENWIIIELNLTNRPGFHQETYIFRDNECISYFLEYLDLLDNFNKSLELKIQPIEKLNKGFDKSIYNLYNILNSKKFNNKIGLKPSKDLTEYYKIIISNNKKLKFYKVNSGDYILRKW